ncbi:MAG: helix-turn-helix transcriptional regulator [Planctomycetota bacterium]
MQRVFGKVVEGLRSFRGLTQAALAESAGVSTAAISRLEKGESNPTLTTLLGLAKGLDLTPAELLEAYQVGLEGAEKSLAMHGPEKGSGDFFDFTWITAAAAGVLGGLAVFMSTRK